MSLAQKGGEERFEPATSRSQPVTPASPTAIRMSTPQIHTLLTAIKLPFLKAVVFTKLQVQIFP